MPHSFSIVLRTTDSSFVKRGGITVFDGTWNVDFTKYIPMENANSKYRCRFAFSSSVLTGPSSGTPPSMRCEGFTMPGLFVVFNGCSGMDKAIYGQSPWLSDFVSHLSYERVESAVTVFRNRFVCSPSDSFPIITTFSGCGTIDVSIRVLNTDADVYSAQIKNSIFPNNDLTRNDWTNGTFSGTTDCRLFDPSYELIIYCEELQ